MESKKISQLATELTPDLSDLTIIGDPTTGISKKITLSQMASLFTGTVEEYANLAAFPLVGVADTIYIALDTNVLYRWDTSTNAYVELSPNIINSLVFSDANGFDGTISLVGSVATLTITTALTTGSVPFIGASGALSQDNANLFFDDTNNRLGIGTNAPTTAIDVFGSGIIGRLNGTSTNNSFLGFASAGTNKWSIGNVQSDHRFRIYSEANTAELVSVLQTGEFGIGIANPTTKFHIDGGASALIANLDANVSVAKSVSFRSDNSNRINLEVSGTESGSDAGANFFIRRYSDAGALIDTPLTITRSTGVILATTTQFNISSTTPTLRLTDSSVTGNGGNVFLRAEKTGIGYNILNYVGFEHIFKGGGSESTFLTISSTGASTFSNSVTSGTKFISSVGNNNIVFESLSATTGFQYMQLLNTTAHTIFGIEGSAAGSLLTGGLAYGSVFTSVGNTALQLGTNQIARLTIASTGNIGIGVTPSAWGAFNALELVNGVHLASYTSGVNILDFGINYYFDGTNYKYKNTDAASSLQMRSGEFRFNTAPSGTAGTSVTLTERIRIFENGNFAIGRDTDAGYKLQIRSNFNLDTSALITCGTPNGSVSHYFFSGTDSIMNVQDANIWVRRNASTSRSINAAGTINALGTDYAEYMIKANTDNISKGDIVGIDINGLLTNIYKDAKSFVVKSTNPSYVGGDNWFNVEPPIQSNFENKEEFDIAYEEFKLQREEARQKVDRIAFSGQVPCNVLNAKVGDYIIPINNNGKISGQAITNPTFEQYQISVGRVWKIMEDTRAWIAVKIG